ncbi:polysaccharide export protein, partial [Sinorhizobium meliloti]
RFDMTKPDSLIVGQTFPVKNRDVIYASRHPSVDITKFLDFVAGPMGTARSGIVLADKIEAMN